MKKGLGIVTCGTCRRTMVVAWPGHKYKVNCPTCAGWKIRRLNRRMDGILSDIERDLHHGQ